MVKELVIVKSESLFPYYNQAVEASLLSLTSEDSIILYIWANDKTVFIGKNQNAFTECNTLALKQDNGFLARRISGGGAVYHDKGNLNFTFLCTKNNYSVSENFAVVLNAVRQFGIDARVSGRNDCTIDDKKFSGNAFYASNGRHFHHGTILINTEGAQISKYLNVSTAKLSTKGVKSVVSRVTNLSTHCPSITYESFSRALENSFINHYKGAAARTLLTTDISKELMDKWQKFFSDEERIMGEDIGYNFRLEQRFEWGVADIRLQLNDGIIEKAKIYTDSLEYDITRKEKTLIGQNLNIYNDCEVSDILLAVSEKAGQLPRA